MKKTVLMLLLAAMSTGAMAEWVPVGGGGDLDGFADPSTRRKNGNNVNMWALSNFKVPQKVGSAKYRSYKELEEYDCAGMRTRNLSITLYSEPMGKGNVVFTSDSPENWIHVTPDTVGEVFWEVACGKTKLK